MRSIVIIALASCGQMYDKPGAEPQPLPASEPVEAPASPKASTKAAQPKPAEPKPDPTPSPEAEPEPAAAGPKAGTDAERFIAAHNKARVKHCAPPLVWSKKLAGIAQKWANSLRDKGCVFGHSAGATYGENLAAGTIGALDPESTVAMWYDEIKLYKFPNGGFSMKTGHFSQLVWRSTKQVGCGHVQCKGNDIYVCNYDPPGNWEGKYRAEVLPASCKK